jgi:glycerol uptake facilitator-like aquaporin
MLFTASTCFANPAVTLARTLTDTFAGIAPSSVPAFLAAQLIGALVAIACDLFLFAPARTRLGSDPPTSDERG